MTPEVDKCLSNVTHSVYLCTRLCPYLKNSEGPVMKLISQSHLSILGPCEMQFL